MPDKMAAIYLPQDIDIVYQVSLPESLPVVGMNVLGITDKNLYL